ncbi:hypothetical protein AMEX_G717 [Astyanax mexicanus]|uniref:Uncharacterized protein n=1 Tax=Astyanax mexicanus TaxID=7994 RepID=A0A8T2MFF8_ASTMX|nr:hypothetical protein AMEX_G717 [Astyanax mexicanus]
MSQNNNFLWDNGKKNVKDLGELILKIFKPGAVVIVVFPDDLYTYTGFQFQKKFEEVVQAKNEGITVGRAVINVYLGLGEQNQKNQVEKLLKDEIEKQTKGKQWDHEKEEKYSSIFAEYNSNKFSFRTVFTPWIIYLKPVNIYQVKIQEADSVVVKLMSVCTSDQNGLKVGTHKEQDLADILLKLLHVDDVKTHPKQRIRVELPENCGKAEQRVAFTGELVDKLQMRNLKAYGKEPMVHIHVYIDEMKNDINHIKKAYPDDIFAKIKDKIENQVNDQNRKSVSSAKELYIHLHCHGIFSHNGTFCGKGSESLAVTLSEFVITLLENSVPKTARIIFNGCEAGSEDGEKYVIRFLTKLDELLHTHKLTVQDSLSYMYETSQINKYTQVMVPYAQHFGPERWSNVNENEAFARFTVRTVKTAEGYRAFHVLPLTEYNLIYK